MTRRRNSNFVNRNWDAEILPAVPCTIRLQDVLLITVFNGELSIIMEVLLIPSLKILLGHIILPSELRCTYFAPSLSQPPNASLTPSLSKQDLGH